MSEAEVWFSRQGWKPLPFQRQAWAAFAGGRSGLIHASTGAGKTYAALLGPLQAMPADPSPARQLRLLWITPLRALSTDTALAIQAAIDGLGLDATLEVRTGDTRASVRRRQQKQLPSVLVTTPESLTLLQTYADASRRFSHLVGVVVDEWHELVGSKRGVQTELALARLRTWNKRLPVWGLSATIGNLGQAMQTLLGREEREGVLIPGPVTAPPDIKVLIPENMEHFPWAGHLGLKLLQQVVDELERVETSLLFTNTRSQAEHWFRALREARPDWEDELAIHHGSIDREVRREAEDRVRAGTLRCVVATSSLDLGVDFSPVDQVIQVGSPKGVARLLQRAGRSGHRPGVASRLVCVPAHAFELLEFAAAEDAIRQGDIEARRPLDKPYDVLAQHLVSVALAGGFAPDALREEIRATASFRDLDDDEFDRVLEFVAGEGRVLQAYPNYHRIQRDGDRYVVPSRSVARLHRMMVGTISSDQAMRVSFLKGGTLGHMEEATLSRLRPGDRFHFAGRTLELVRVRDMTAYVRRARGNTGTVPAWMGGRMPLSSRLADAVRARIGADGSDPAMQALEPIMQTQAAVSKVPTRNMFLVEQTRSREGDHVFLFPFAGRNVHEGLAALLAHRLTRIRALTVHGFFTDYGIELLCSSEWRPTEEELRELVSPVGLRDDILAALNAAEMARRSFRGIARVAGLVFSGYPGKRKSAGQLQASSKLFYEVFRNYEPDNILLRQAEREVLEDQLDFARLEETLDRLHPLNWEVVPTERFSPFAFPIWAERTHHQVSSEKWIDRVRRMSLQLEKRAARMEVTA